MTAIAASCNHPFFHCPCLHGQIAASCLDWRFLIVWFILHPLCSLGCPDVCFPHPFVSSSCLNEGARHLLLSCFLSSFLCLSKSRFCAFQCPRLQLGRLLYRRFRSSMSPLIAVLDGRTRVLRQGKSCSSLAMSMGAMIV